MLSTFTSPRFTWWGYLQRIRRTHDEGYFKVESQINSSFMTFGIRQAAELVLMVFGAIRSFRVIDASTGTYERITGLYRACDTRSADSRPALGLSGLPQSPPCLNLRLVLWQRGTSGTISGKPLPRALYSLDGRARGRLGRQGKLVCSTTLQKMPVKTRDLKGHKRKEEAGGPPLARSRYRAPVNGTTVGTTTGKPMLGSDLGSVWSHVPKVVATGAQNTESLGAGGSTSSSTVKPGKSDGPKHTLY
ncbi:hypothetical protein RF11_13104 [Thelohanellus kitauei]|uniref:Uncharacterized protein n=1 Tax=Thelohanellus kitauei TaxID=669202 RepID=A0A0C2IK74_THEKT|nr:hypothetical protein RF11_13104 [Thelohanellus kitauei]